MRFLFLLSLALAGNTYALETAHYIESTAGGGSVNWTTGRVQAEGFGIAPTSARQQVAGLLACRAAVADGQRNLLETIQGVRVSSQTTVSNYVTTNDLVKTAVEGTVKGAQILSREISADNTCQVVLEVSVQGDVTKSVYETQFSAANQSSMSPINRLWSLLDKPFFPTVMAAPEQNVKMIEAPWEQSILELKQRVELLEKRAAMSSTLSTKPAQNTPTGVVIDARGSNFIPSMSPKLRKLRGEVLYPTRASGEATRQSGQLVSLFTRSVEFALSHPKVGDRPLLLKALRTYGDTRTEIVVSSDAATKINQLIEQTFFNEGGVIIVLD